MPVSSWNLPGEKVINNLYGYTNWTSMRYMPPLHEIEKEWQPCLERIPVYHFSGAELLQGGWNKWNSAGHPDILAQSSTAVEPDWYTRRRQDIRNADKKFCEHWAYDRWSKPNSFTVLGCNRQAPVGNETLQPITGKQKTTTRPSAVHTGIKPIHYGIGEGFSSCKFIPKTKEKKSV
ncbi:unnamed protein product [Trichobilharzia szidati]|nr:unnamed protein product [Trichobilharzia szidati]